MTPPLSAPTAGGELASLGQVRPVSVRRALRRFVVATLKGRTKAGSSVFAMRPSPPQRAELPAIFVHSKDEPTSRFQVTPTAYERTLRLWIDVYAEEGDVDRSEDLVDEIAAEVEHLMELVAHSLTEASRRPECPFGFNPDKSGLAETQMDTDDEGARLEAGCRITWELVYVVEIDEAVLLADKIEPFRVASLGWDVDGDGLAEVSDTVPMPQPE